MIKINCDLAERGADHPVDIALMAHIQVANIACGGHAGDAQSASVFRKLAERHDVMVAAHLSYPDRENFGRRSLDLEPDALLESLDAQMQLAPGIKAVKFHGALYNDSVVDQRLSRRLARWASAQGIETIIAPADSEMADACAGLHIRVMAEAFAERRYTVDARTGRLCLVSRAKPYASIHEVNQAVVQAEKIAREQKVQAFFEEDNAEPSRRDLAITAETICIHSDARIALELARALLPLTR